MTDLTKLSDPQLIDHYAGLRAQLAALQQQVAELTPLVTERAGRVVVEIMRGANLSLADLAGPPAAKPTRKRVIRYHDPATGQVWTGQGHVPHWLKGRDIEQFRIPPTPLAELDAYLAARAR